MKFIIIINIIIIIQIIFINNVYLFVYLLVALLQDQFDFNQMETRGSIMWQTFHLHFTNSLPGHVFISVWCLIAQLL